MLLSSDTAEPTYVKLSVHGESRCRAKFSAGAARECLSAGWIPESLEELNSAGTEDETVRTVLINP